MHILTHSFKRKNNPETYGRNKTIRKASFSKILFSFEIILQSWDATISLTTKSQFKYITDIINNFYHTTLIKFYFQHLLETEIC